MQRQSPDRPTGRPTRRPLRRPPLRATTVPGGTRLRPATPPTLDLATRTGTHHHVLDVTGAVHAETVGVLRDELASLAADPGRSRLVVDLRGVTFLDGHGLGALVGGLRQLRQAGGCLHPVGNTLVDSLLTATGLDRVLVPEDSVTAADSTCHRPTD